MEHLKQLRHSVENGGVSRRDLKMLDKASEPPLPIFARAGPTYNDGQDTSNLPNPPGKANLNQERLVHSNNNDRMQHIAHLSNLERSLDPTEDEFSDFQSAPSIPPANQVNNSLPGPVPQRNNPLYLHNIDKTIVSPLFTQNRPPASSNMSREGIHKQSVVGCRLANYDLGIPTASPRMSQQQQQHQTPPMMQSQFTNFIQNYNQPQQHPTNGDSLLIGEEDKYSALRGIFDDTPSENLSTPGASTLNCFESQTSVTHDEGNVSHKISLVSDDVLEIVKTESADKYVDFGEFQSFNGETYDNGVTYPSYHASSTVFGAAGACTGLFDLSVGLNKTAATHAIDTPFIPLASSESLTTPAATFPVQRANSNSLSDGEFGDFVSYNNADGNGSPKLLLKTEVHTKKSTSGTSVKSKKSPHGVNKINITRIAKASNILTDSPTPSYPKLSDLNQVPNASLFYDTNTFDVPTPTIPSSFASTSIGEDIDFGMSASYCLSTISDPLDKISKSEFGGHLKTTLIGSSANATDDFGEFATANQLPRIESMLTSKMNSLDLLPVCKPVKTHSAVDTHSLSSLDLGTYLESDGKGYIDLEASPDSSGILDFGSYDKEKEMDTLNSDISQSDTCQLTAPVLVVSPISGSSNQVEDKYKCFMDEVENERERYASEWSRCLTTCLKLISFANNILNAASSSEVVREIVSNDKGNVYIQNLYEVYLVAYRIHLTCKKLGGGLKVQQLFKEITAAWELVSSFLIGTPLMEYVNAVNDWREGDYSDCVKVCGVCLINSADEDPESLLDYGGKYYHPTCANLWINEVDSILPSLYCVSLL